MDSLSPQFWGERAGVRGVVLPLGWAFLLGVYSNLAQVAALRLAMGLFYGTELHCGLFLGTWLAGISLGGGVAGRWPLPLRWLMAGLCGGPLLVLGVLWMGSGWLPPLAGGFLPALPVLALLALMVLPLSVPVGLFLPSLLVRRGTTFGPVYASEALGSFVGGMGFSLVLGGLASSLLTLVALPVLAGTMVVLARPRWWSGLAVLLWAGWAATGGAALEGRLEERFWSRFHPGYTLETTRETPYQKIQVGTYLGQRSLFLNGVFSGSWPEPQRAEERVHLFMTALPHPREVLVIGAPTSDFTAECLKYPGCRFTFVELDRTLADLLREGTPASASVTWAIEDPRAFLRRGGARFDGLLVLSTDPTTLVGNRLFTGEALADMRRCLTASGVLSLAVSGSENYLGPELEQVILSAHRCLVAVFADVAPIPGDPLIFWAAAAPGVLVRDPEMLGERFSSRQIPTSSFFAPSFANLLLPFRVAEVESWLRRPVVVEGNTDLHPRVFARQLLLWDVYSDSRLRFLFQGAAWLTLPRAMALAALVLLIVLAWGHARGPARAAPLVYSVGVAVSGGAGLLAELILVLLYQNRHGALFRMLALFFGCYMLGLAAGAFAGRRLGERGGRFLLWVKGAQILAALLCLGLAGVPEWHGAWVIGGCLFLVAFLAGVEFPAVDRLLRGFHLAAPASAGLLLFADNLGAMALGFLSGPWLLPVLGLRDSLVLIVGSLGLNLLLLLWFFRRGDPAPDA